MCRSRRRRGDQWGRRKKCPQVDVAQRSATKLWGSPVTRLPGRPGSTSSVCDGGSPPSLQTLGPSKGSSRATRTVVTTDARRIGAPSQTRMNWVGRPGRAQYPEALFVFVRIESLPLPFPAYRPAVYIRTSTNRLDSWCTSTSASFGGEFAMAIKCRARSEVSFDAWTQ